MKFGELTQKLREHASDLKSGTEKNGKFRARGYDRAADKLESKFDADDKVTKALIDTTDLTKHMKSTSWKMTKTKSGKKKSSKSGKKASGKKKVKTIKGRKSRDRSRSRSRSRSKSLSKTKKKKDLSASKKTALKKSLTGFMGIGDKLADQLIIDGLTNINQLHMKKWMAKLNKDTKAYLELKPEKKIPHEDIKALEPILLQIADENKFNITLVGSYRRKKPTSSDIDIMLVSEDPDAIEKFLKMLQKEVPNDVFPYSQGKDKMSFILDATNHLNRKSKKQLVYKLDVFRVIPANEIPMLLYSTGSAQHNIMMRSLAKRKGMLLNQKGLFEKLDDGSTQKIKGLKSEEDYFTALDLEYALPEDRK